MSEGGKSRNPDSYRDRKSGSPKVRKESKVERPKQKAVLRHDTIDPNSAPDSYRDDIPHSAIKELPTANQKLPTENMEVHHHPEVERKTFKQYLLEGLMIFMAVFMGFVAENIREQIADHEHEKQYMESMVRDLELDTTILDKGFPRKELRLAAIDTVFQFFESHAEPKTIPFSVYRNIKRALWDRIYVRNTATINQLRNAGGLRLIRKQNVRDSIATYDQFWDRLNYYKEAYYTYQMKAGDMIEKMVNAQDVLQSYRLNNTGSSLYPSLSNSSIIRINTAGLNEYLNFLGRQKITTTQDMENYKALKGKAVNLIQLIKKEYNLE